MTCLLQPQIQTPTENTRTHLHACGAVPSCIWQAILQAQAGRVVRRRAAVTAQQLATIPATRQAHSSSSSSRHQCVSQTVTPDWLKSSQASVTQGMWRAPTCYNGPMLGATPGNPPAHVCRCSNCQPTPIPRQSSNTRGAGWQTWPALHPSAHRLPAPHAHHPDPAAQ